MFTYIVSAIRSLRAHNAVRIQPDLSLLDQLDRNSIQEHLAQNIETRLFFDAELLASAQLRQSVASGFKKTLLACGAGLLLIVSPMSGQAEDGDGSEPTPVESSSTDDQTTPTAKPSTWLEDLIGLFDGDDDDPTDGDH